MSPPDESHYTVDNAGWIASLIADAPIPPDEWAVHAVANQAKRNGHPVAQVTGDTNTDLADRYRAAMLHGDQILTIAPRRLLIAGLLDLDSFAVTQGPPGSAKTAVIDDQAIAIARGNWWHGLETHEGHVVILRGEGSAGSPGRYAAAKLQNGIHGDLPQFHLLPVRANLRAAEYAAAVAVAVGDHQPVYVVIDTLSRYSGGGNENSSEDMTAFIEGCDTIREQTGACVNAIHHTGKDHSAGARGHSSLLGAADTEIEIRRDGTTITMAVSKQKDHAPATPRRFTLAPTDVTIQGVQLSSIAIAPYTGDSDDGTLTAADRSALDVLRTIDVEGGVSTSIWRDVALDTISRSAFYVALRKLVESRAVQNVGTAKQPRYTLADLQEQDDEF